VTQIVITLLAAIRIFQPVWEDGEDGNIVHVSRDEIGIGGYLIV
jgi:hypothetical protein